MFIHAFHPVWLCALYSLYSICLKPNRMKIIDKVILPVILNTKFEVKKIMALQLLIVLNYIHRCKTDNLTYSNPYNKFSLAYIKYKH